MAKDTQYQRIYEMCADGEWHCNCDFWALYSRSPHKRRQEMVEMGWCKAWESQVCEHGQRGVRDHRMVKLENETERIQAKYEIFPGTLEALEKITLTPQGEQATNLPHSKKTMGTLQTNNQKTLW